MGRPKLNKKERKSRLVSVRMTDETYNKLLSEAKDPRKIGEVIRRKAETA